MAARYTVPDPPHASCREHFDSDHRDIEVIGENNPRDYEESYNEMNHVTDWVAVIKPLLSVPTASLVRAELLDICKAILGR